MSEPPPDFKRLAEAWQASPMFHPFTCNGGNPDFATHHDHEVILAPGDTGFTCPECGRFQEYGEWGKRFLLAAARSGVEGS